MLANFKKGIVANPECVAPHPAFGYLSWFIFSLFSLRVGLSGLELEKFDDNIRTDYC